MGDASIIDGRILWRKSPLLLSVVYRVVLATLTTPSILLLSHSCNHWLLRRRRTSTTTHCSSRERSTPPVKIASGVESLWCPAIFQAWWTWGRKVAGEMTGRIMSTSLPMLRARSFAIRRSGESRRPRTTRRTQLHSLQYQAAAGGPRLGHYSLRSIKCRV